MSEQDTLLTALQALSDRWLAQSQDAIQQGQRLSVGNMQQAFYQRGIAEGLRIALTDIQQLLANGQEEPVQTPEATYAFVSREAALALLGQAGIHVNELHQHEDHTFSAILPPLQVFSFEERFDKLRTHADIVILATGKLPSTNKAYVDFAFTSSYSP
jgi:hypothetical protein